MKKVKVFIVYMIEYFNIENQKSLAVMINNKVF